MAQSIEAKRFRVAVASDLCLVRARCMEWMENGEMERCLFFFRTMDVNVGLVSAAVDSEWPAMCNPPSLSLSYSLP